MLFLCKKHADCFITYTLYYNRKVVSLCLIPYNESDVDLLARLIRAEAEGEGRQGEELVGCVVVNRVFCDCLDFKQLRTVRDAVYQSPGGFEAVQYGYFINALVNQKKKLHEKFYKVNGAGMHDGLFGISVQLELVRLNGIISHL